MDRSASRPHRRRHTSITGVRPVEDGDVDHALVQAISRRTGVPDAAVIAVLRAALDEIPPDALPR